MARLTFKQIENQIRIWQRNNQLGLDAVTAEYRSAQAALSLDSPVEERLAVERKRCLVEKLRGAEVANEQFLKLITGEYV